MILSFGVPFALGPGMVNEMTQNLLGGAFCWPSKRRADNRVFSFLQSVVVAEATGSSQTRVRRIIANTERKPKGGSSLSKRAELKFLTVRTGSAYPERKGVTRNGKLLF